MCAINKGGELASVKQERADKGASLWKQPLGMWESGEKRGLVFLASFNELWRCPHPRPAKCVCVCAFVCPLFSTHYVPLAAEIQFSLPLRTRRPPFPQIFCCFAPCTGGGDVLDDG